MILNNCSNCGRKPSILRCLPVLAKNYHAYCKCGKAVEPILGNTWTAEVAADMWNRANPQEEKTMHSDYINYLADQASKHGLKAKIDDWGNLDFAGAKLAINRHDHAVLALELIKFRLELTEFYKKRLEPGVKV